MNYKQYWESPKSQGDKNKEAHELLEQWKNEHNVTERMVIHHRDDNEEVRKYNAEHYELWGFREDGSFNYGEYVVYMTVSEHARYHNGNGKSSMIGWHPSEETRQRMSESAKVKVFSDEHRKHLSESCSGELNGFYGKTHSKEQCDKWSQERKGVTWGSHSDESKSKISNKQQQYWRSLRERYNAFKLQHPESTITIRQFQSIH